VTTQRLVGLNVLAVCCFLLTAAAVLIALLPFGSPVLRSLALPVDASLVWRLFMALSMSAGALLIGLAGRGLMKGEKWARTLVLFVTGAQTIRPVLGLLAGSDAWLRSAP
jgi:hypothetical protein